jgi:valyl-tRNA synthetase
VASAAAGGEGDDRTVAGALEVAAAVITEIRGAKSSAKVSMRNPVESVVVSDTAERLALLELVAGDVCEAGRVEDLGTAESDEFAVEVTLGEAD